MLIEALALGTPAVATNCQNGPAEILEHGHYGPLTPVDDVKALAEAIIQTLHKPPASDFLKKAVQRFTAETVTEQYLGLLVR